MEGVTIPKDPDGWVKRPDPLLKKIQVVGGVRCENSCLREHGRLNRCNSSLVTHSDAISQKQNRSTKDDLARLITYKTTSIPLLQGEIRFQRFQIAFLDHPPQAKTTCLGPVSNGEHLQVSKFVSTCLRELGEGLMMWRWIRICRPIFRKLPSSIYWN